MMSNPIPTRTFGKIKTNDPQIKVTGRLKKGANNDLITFSIPLAFFEIVCIANIPFEGTDEAPVYVKFKIHRKAEVEVAALTEAFERPRRIDRANANPDTGSGEEDRDDDGQD
jgi:hypothetical protein